MRRTMYILGVISSVLGTVFRPLVTVRLRKRMVSQSASSCSWNDRCRRDSSTDAESVFYETPTPG